MRLPSTVLTPQALANAVASSAAMPAADTADHCRPAQWLTMGDTIQLLRLRP